MRAAATAWARTESSPKSLAKKPGAGRLTFTRTVSAETLTSPGVTPPSFLSAYSIASERAVDGVGLEPLRAGERGRVGGRLRMPVGAVPRADVEDERRQPDEDGEKGDGHHQRLAALILEPVHSTRSVAVLDIVPECTTMPMMLMSNGKVARTTTSSPWFQVEVTLTFPVVKVGAEIACRP